MAPRNHFSLKVEADCQKGEACNVGKVRHQKFVCKIVAHFKKVAVITKEIDIADVFSTNAIFVMSRKADDVPDKLQRWKQCWSIHQYLLSIVRPKLIFCLGNSGMSPFGLLYEESDPKPLKRNFGSPGKSYQPVKGFVGAFKVTDALLSCVVIGVPHPSRWGWLAWRPGFLAALDDALAELGALPGGTSLGRTIAEDI